jgi:hypothetical protein
MIVTCFAMPHTKSQLTAQGENANFRRLNAARTHHAVSLTWSTHTLYGVWNASPSS